MWSVTTTAVNLLIALILGYLRIVGDKSERYQAIVHVYLGGLCGYSLASWQVGKPIGFYLVLIGGLIVTELVCAMVLSKVADRPL